MARTLLGDASFPHGLGRPAVPQQKCLPGLKCGRRLVFRSSTSGAVSGLRRTDLDNAVDCAITLALHAAGPQRTPLIRPHSRESSASTPQAPGVPGKEPPSAIARWLRNSFVATRSTLTVTARTSAHLPRTFRTRFLPPSPVEEPLLASRRIATGVRANSLRCDTASTTQSPEPFWTPTKFSYVPLSGSSVPPKKQRP